MKNNSGAGATQAKTGDQKTTFDRGAAFGQTMGAMESKTRSPFNSAGGPNYHYQDPSCTDLGGNVKGKKD